ncbi:MAG: tRNA (guanosine(46)-N7)-methyltransferase TrmB [Synergistaceae bacterium]|nr:tRNA (guanosine(46)-N7)-methyltransferase TrmB [Synergistaceae bacterium]
MDFLSATTQARPQYGVIIKPESGLPLPVKTHTQLEIGFGNGEFTVQYAKAKPEIFLYGVEISQSCVLRCARRAEGLDNLQIINTDARYMLRELFEDESLEKIIMQFPCPWPGNGNAHRRITARDFSDGLAAVLKVGGVFEMVSDDEDYANEVWKILGLHEALKAKNLEVNPTREITTKYERKWLAQGKNIFRLTFTKTKKFTVSRRTSRDMHIKINTRPTQNDIDAMKNISGKDESKKSFWRFGKNFTDGERFLLETLTSDDEFEQKFYINISPRDEGFLIRLDRTSSAFLTPAVRSALNDVATRLSS